jgi:CheY-like chemotaxis protein
MRTLLVEDDAAKREAILAYLLALSPMTATTEVGSFTAAIQALRQGEFDLVLLDMTIPSLPQSTSDRDSVLVFGGRDVLRQMRRLGVTIPVIVITAYERFDEGRESMRMEELQRQLCDIYPQYYLGAVGFSFRNEVWKTELGQLISTLFPNDAES